MEFINGFFCGTLVMSLLFLAYAMLVDTGKKKMKQIMKRNELEEKLCFIKYYFY